MKGKSEFPANFGRPFLDLLTIPSDSHIILALHHSMNCHCILLSKIFSGIFFVEISFCLNQATFVLKIFSLWGKVFDLWVTNTTITCAKYSQKSIGGRVMNIKILFLIWRNYCLNKVLRMINEHILCGIVNYGTKNKNKISKMPKLKF
ncbi:hypothetical protein BpHYR1_051256 [Brachionus plicatilis]|uniref:Uncharacterized protein n=1 Tax=Brachionus plicatilis TaxID=10195 RepID=A0A3M7T9E4_BRAPC|nr:hypothetical protein BpHYR1_051256 [Brachionus plicatilis]